MTTVLLLFEIAATILGGDPASGRVRVGGDALLDSCRDEIKGPYCARMLDDYPYRHCHVLGYYKRVAEESGGATCDLYEGPGPWVYATDAKAVELEEDACEPLPTATCE